jgi:two-component system nitrogen regulation sensor histidine kinase NtrY
MPQLKSFFRNNRFYLFAFVISGLFYFFLVLFNAPTLSMQKTSQRVSSQLQSDRNEMSILADAISAEIEKLESNSLPAAKVDIFKNLFLQKSDIAVFVFSHRSDSLLLWNSNTVVFGPNEICEVNSEGEFIVLQNGYYLKTCRITDNYRILLLYSVYSFYPIQNTYLLNGFDARFGIGASTSKLLLTPSEEAYPVFALRDNEPLFYIVPSGKSIASESNSLTIVQFLLLIVFLSFLYQLIAAFYAVLPFSKSNEWMRIIGLLADIVIIQLILRLIGPHIFRLPDQVFTPELFSYGSLLPSLGWLVIHLHAVLFITVAVFKRYALPKKSIKNVNHFLGVLAALIIPFTLFFGFHLITLIFGNSNVTYNLDQIQYQNVWIWFVYLCAAAIVINSLMLFFVFTKLLSSSGIQPYYMVFYVSISLVFSYLLFKNHVEFIYLLFFIVACLTIIELSLNYYNKTLINSALAVIVTLIAMALLMNFIVSELNHRKAEQEQIFTSRQLSIDNDPMFEFLFKDLRQQILNDDSLRSMLQVGNGNTFDDNFYSYLKSNYLKDYFNKFTSELTLCNQFQQLIVQPENMTINCFLFFDELIRLKGKETTTEGLYLIDDNVQGIYYLAHIPIKGGNGTSEYNYRIFLEFYFKYIPEGIGYPELLIDEQSGFSRDFRSYSFATYRDGILVYKFGNYLYPTRIQSLTEEDTGFFERNSFKHFIAPINESKLLIVSRKTPDFSEITAPFAYFFILLGLLCVLLLIIIANTTDFKTFGLSFRSKLQMLVLISVLLSFIIVGISSTYYITDIYIKKNDDFLSEKTQSILIELEHKLKNEDLSKDGMEEYLHQLLLKFSLVFFSDINMYDLSGKLMASSRPEIYDKGLLSRTMNPEAYFALRYDNKLYFSHQEVIGNGTYMSSYIPFKDTQGRAVAYINLPYFARESEIRSEIATFIAAYINLFLALAGISVAMALLFSRRLTLPLQMIQKKMQLIRFGKSNEKIVWKSSDELGQLVNQYNTLLDQLTESADLLARSERETAWREMARQVAHEIKNPLTPMRLSVQYLQKAWQEKDPDIDQKMRNTTQTLIQQIDTLSSIASAFSDFARMPQNKAENINLSEVIRYCIALFDHTESIRLEFIDSTQGQAFMKADKENLSRVFVNLIKNSIQAIGTSRTDGFVKISLYRVANEYIIDVFDNGKGMNEEDRKKVFTPNFTTKSSGTGIGLSIVNSIIASAGGRISFWSEAGKGAEFKIALPIDYQANFES